MSILVLYFGESVTSSVLLKSKEEIMQSVAGTLLKEQFGSDTFLKDLKQFEENNYRFIFISKSNCVQVYNTSKKNLKITKEDIDILRKGPPFSGNGNSEDEDFISGLTGTKNQFTLYKENKSFALLVQTSSLEFQYQSKIYSVFASLTTLLISMLLVLISFVFTSTLTNPLKKVSECLTAITNKDFSVRCSVKNNDEIGLVADEVNEVALSLGDYSKKLSLANKKLQEDINVQKRTEELQKSFISNMSHEIKTPISIISGYAEAIMYGLAEDTETLNEYCEAILSECNRVTSLSKQLLDLARAENHETELNYSDFSINELCDEVASLFDIKAKSLNIEIKKDYYCKKTVSADRELIKTVLVNFLQNACKYTPEKGKVTIIIKPAKSHIYLGIHNTGSTISDENREKVWNKFYKVDESHTRDGDSTGLGLSICKAINELHNGKYGCKNTKNGVEFFFYI